MTNRLGLSVSIASGEWIPLEMAIIFPVMDAPLGQKNIRNANGVTLRMVSPIYIIMWKLFDLHSQIIHDEAVDVGLLLEYFAHRLSTAVACLAVDADEHGAVALVTLLQRGSKLERVCRNDAVVVVGSGDERGGIFDSFLQIVQRRIAFQVFKHFL